MMVTEKGGQEVREKGRGYFDLYSNTKEHVQIV